jgi:hypothetical protein
MSEKTESGMAFTFNAEHFYSIEEDVFYSKLTSQYHAKVCDFILKKGSGLVLLEAKSSAPQDSQRLAAYIHELQQKFQDSLLTYVAVLHKRKNTRSETITAEMNAVTNLKGGIKLVVVINGMKKAHLPELKTLLERACRKLTFIFSIDAVVVMNDEQARSRNWVQ